MALLWHLRYQNSFYKSKSQPPSISASTCCLRDAQIIQSYGSVSGSFTSGDMLAVLFVGPMEPATKRGFVWIFCGKFISYFAGNLPTHSSIHTFFKMVISHTDGGS
jgi:hypothetical protein